MDVHPPPIALYRPEASLYSLSIGHEIKPTPFLWTNQYFRYYYVYNFSDVKLARQVTALPVHMLYRPAWSAAYAASMVWPGSKELIR